MIEKVLVRNNNEAVIYFTDGRPPFTVKVDEEVLLDVLHNLIYTMEASCILSKAA